MAEKKHVIEYTDIIKAFEKVKEKLKNKSDKGHQHGNADITDIDASKIKSGTIDIDRLPKGAIERMVYVKDDAARFALTTNTTQNGDTVKVRSTKKMFYVIDDTKLSSEAGYESYTAESASAVPWSGVTGKPTTFTPEAHTHAISDVADLQETLTGLRQDVNAKPSKDTNTTYSLIQDSTDGHKLTFKGSDGSTKTVTIPDNDHNDNTWRDVVDSLDSTRTDASLSANQGRVLNERTFQMRGVIGKSTDFNTITTIGCYKVQMDGWGDQSIFHSPNEYSSQLYSYGLLVVNRAWNDGEYRIVQVYYPHVNSNTVSGAIVTRMNNGNSWNSWNSIAKGGDCAKVNGHTIDSDVPANAKFTDTDTWRGIQDNLTSTSTSDSLSANQGRILNGKFAGYLPLHGTADTANSAKYINYSINKYVTGDSMKTPCWRFATIEVSSDWYDQSVVLLVNTGCIGGGFGIIKLSVRSNQISNTENAYCEFSWLVRRGFDPNQFVAKGYSASKTTNYFDIYFKATGVYQGITVTVLSSGSRGDISFDWKLTNDEPRAAMDLRTYNYELVSSDEGVVDYASTANHLYNTQTDGVKNSMTFHWDSKDGQPTWLWGGTDGSNMYVYNPSNFSVNYANSAGSANSVAWTNVSGRPTSLPASDVYSWAKASSKPSYSWSEIGGRPTALSSFTNDRGFITGNDSRLTNARPASDVYSWAKASSKPSYTWTEISNKPDIPSISKYTPTRTNWTISSEYNCVVYRIGDFCLAVVAVTGTIYPRQWLPAAQLSKDFTPKIQSSIVICSVSGSDHMECMVTKDGYIKMWWSGSSPATSANICVPYYMG